MRIAKLLVIVLALSLVFGSLNCKKSSPTESSIDDLIGTWKSATATEGTEFSYTSKSSPPISYNLLMFQATIDVTIRSDKSYTLTLVVPPLEINEVEEGKISVSGNKVTMTANNFPDEAITFEFSLSGNLLTLIDNNAEFDFNFDDIDEPAILKIVMRKLN